MSSDISSTVGGGSSSITSPDSVTPASAPPASSTGVGSTPDTISSSSSSGKKKSPVAYSPELLQAMFLLWSMGGPNAFALQQLSGGGSATSIGGVNSGGHAISGDAFIMQTQAKMDEICLKVLNAWTESVHKQAEETKREMKTEAYRHWERVHQHAGYKAWLDTLSPEQRLQVQTYPHLDKVAGISDGVTGLSDFLVKMKTNHDPKVSQDLPFLTAAVIMGGALTPLPDTVSTQILVQPLKDASDKILYQYAPNHAAELGYLGALMMTGSSYFALGLTVPKAAAPPAEINYEFAKNYAQTVLSLVNGSEFNSMAMALYTTRIDSGEHIGEERISQLVKALKLVLLGLALSLLYKTESEFKGKDGTTVEGGITGKEFLALIKPNKTQYEEGLVDSDLKKQLVAAIAEASAGWDSTKLIHHIAAYVDNSKKASDLIDIGGVLKNISFDQEAAGSVFAA